MKARKEAMLANRNLGAGNDYDQPKQHPHVADLVWALAKSEAAKLELAKQRALEEAAATGGKSTPTVAGPSIVHTLEAKVDARPRPAKTRIEVVDKDEEEDRVELGFSLHINQLKSQTQGYDNKDGDSGVLFQSANFASSFNTDVGYSSETSRAPSYPSSVVFKRRTYTSKSISQNYSSLTESIGSQPVDMEGDVLTVQRSSPSPLMDPDDLLTAAAKMRRNRHNHLQQPFNGDPRRLSYKRACDPDKRISLAFDSMLSGDSDLSYGSQVLAPPPQAPPDANHLGLVPREEGQHPRRPSSSGSSAKGHQYVSEGTETDDRWLKRRQSYQKSCGGARINHLTATPQRQSGLRQNISLQCILSAVRFVRSILNHVIQSPWMDFFITVSIILNTAFLAAEHHGMSPDVKHVLDVGNKVRIPGTIGPDIKDLSPYKELGLFGLKLPSV